MITFAICQAITVKFFVHLQCIAKILPCNHCLKFNISISRKNQAAFTLPHPALPAPTGQQIGIRQVFWLSCHNRIENKVIKKQ